MRNIACTSIHMKGDITMANFSRLIIASAVAAALAGPAVLAQTSQSERGATEVNPSPSGQQPNPGDRMNQRSNETGSGAGRSTGEIQRDATPIRPGGQAAPDRTTDPSRRGSTAGTGSGSATSQIERNPTDIRPGGQTNSGTDPAKRSGSMKHGAYGSPTVRDAQQALQAKGYDVGESDGVMGPRTQSAIRDFQQQQGLPVSGRLDRATRSALNLSSAEPALSPTTRTS